MNFQPKTEKELQEQDLWPKGEYDFEIVKSEPATSGPNSKVPGTRFIKLLVKIFQGESSKLINAILHPAMEAQLRHFCEEAGILSKYDSGSLQAADCEGRDGRLQLKIKDAEGNFPAKNEVQDWGAKKKAGKDVSAPKAQSVNGSSNPKLQVADTDDGDAVPF